MFFNACLVPNHASRFFTDTSWAITDGQKLAANLGYVPLPARVVKGDQDTLRLLTFKGTPLYTGP
jgi:hypothetical protein